MPPTNGQNPALINSDISQLRSPLAPSIGDSCVSSTTAGAETVSPGASYTAVDSLTSFEHSERLRLMQKALASTDGWSSSCVNQDTQWEAHAATTSLAEQNGTVPYVGAPLYDEDIQSARQRALIDGTDIWHSMQRNGARTNSAMSNMRMGDSINAPWPSVAGAHHVPQSDIGGTWGEDDGCLNTGESFWSANNSLLGGVANTATLGVPPPLPWNSAPPTLPSGSMLKRDDWCSGWPLPRGGPAVTTPTDMWAVGVASAPHSSVMPRSVMPTNQYTASTCRPQQPQQQNMMNPAHQWSAPSAAVRRADVGAMYMGGGGVSAGVHAHSLASSAWPEDKPVDCQLGNWDSIRMAGRSLSNHQWKMNKGRGVGKDETLAELFSDSGNRSASMMMSANSSNNYGRPVVAGGAMLSEWVAAASATGTPNTPLGVSNVASLDIPPPHCAALDLQQPQSHLNPSSNLSPYMSRMPAVGPRPTLPVPQASAQQLRPLINQIQTAIQAGHLNPSVLQQPMGAQTLLLLNHLLNQIKSLEQLNRSYAQNARALPANSPLLSSLTMEIMKVKNSIVHLQSQISMQQLAENQAGVAQHTAAATCMSGAISACPAPHYPSLDTATTAGAALPAAYQLTSSFGDLSLSAAVEEQGGGAGTSSQSRFSGQWRPTQLIHHSGQQQQPATLSTSAVSSWSSLSLWPADVTSVAGASAGVSTDAAQIWTGIGVSTATADVLEFKPGKPWKMKACDDGTQKISRADSAVTGISDSMCLNHPSRSESVWNFGINNYSTDGTTVHTSGTDGSLGSVWSTGFQSTSSSSVPEACNWLIIHNIHAQMDEAHLRALCCQYGTIVVFRISLHTGTAFIKYSEPDSASRAKLSLSSYRMDSNTVLHTELASNEIVQQQLHSYMAQGEPPSAPATVPVDHFMAQIWDSPDIPASGNSQNSAANLSDMNAAWVCNMTTSMSLPQASSNPWYSNIYSSTSGAVSTSSSSISGTAAVSATHQMDRFLPDGLL